MITVREAQVIKLIADGKSNPEIAKVLNIGQASVKTHVHNILTKLNLANRREVIIWYLEN